MAVYKRGRVYWYKFEFRGQRYQASTRLRNIDKARAFEAKLKTDLAMSVVGLAALPLAPTFEKFSETFKDFLAVRSKASPRTIDFYEEKLKRLLEFKPIKVARLHLIGESLIEEYVQHRRKKVGPASINRELATLRRMLYIAKRTYKLISDVPGIHLLPGEREREFVLSHDQEKAYLAVAEQPLADFAVLSIDTGIRIGEGVSLKWDDVHTEPAANAKLGYIIITRGKSKNAKRVLSLSARARDMLLNRRRFYPGEPYVFPGRSKGKHILASSLGHQHIRARGNARMEDGSELPKAFVIHSLRHTFGTRFGESGADAFTIMKFMGHSSVTVSQKYVHPTPDFMERAFKRLDAMNKLMRGEEGPGVVTESGTVTVEGS